MAFKNKAASLNQALKCIYSVYNTVWLLDAKIQDKQTTFHMDFL